MTYKIEITNQADKDLREIYKYIAFELQAPENANGQLSRLEKSITGLDHMPERFRRYKKEPWRSRGLRLLPVDNFCVMYIPDVENAIVTIIRVMYGGRNIDNILEKYTLE